MTMIGVDGHCLECGKKVESSSHLCNIPLTTNVGDISKESEVRYGLSDAGKEVMALRSRLAEAEKLLGMMEMALRGHEYDRDGDANDDVISARAAYDAYLKSKEVSK